MNPDAVPVKIELDRSSHLLVAWADGLSARWDIEDLRLACQCAQCRHRRDQGLRSVPDDGVVPAASDAKYVGSYALGIEWVDGKCNSIYSFETLRSWAEHGADNGSRSLQK